MAVTIGHQIQASRGEDNENHKTTASPDSAEQEKEKQKSTGGASAALRDNFRRVPFALPINNIITVSGRSSSQSGARRISQPNFPLIGNEEKRRGFRHTPQRGSGAGKHTLIIFPLGKRKSRRRSSISSTDWRVLDQLSRRTGSFAALPVKSAEVLYNNKQPRSKGYD